MIAAGEPAPDFTLRDQDGEEVSLSDFRGRKVLLVFYPFDFSPVCSDQLSIYQEVKPEIASQGRRDGRDQRRPALRAQGLPGEARHRHDAARRLRAQGRGRARPTAPTSTASASPTAPSSSSTRTARSPGPTNRRTRASSPAPTSSSTPSSDPRVCIYAVHRTALVQTRAAMTDLTSAAVPPIGPDDHVRGEGEEGLIVYADLGCPHCAVGLGGARRAPRGGSPSATSRSPASTRARRPCTRPPRPPAPRASSSRWSTRSTPIAATSTTRISGSGPSASGSTWSASSATGGRRRSRRGCGATSSPASAPELARHSSGFRCLYPCRRKRTRVLKKSEWPPTGRPEVGQLNEHV